MKFNYYYGSQADQFSFIRIPKVMLTEETFSSLSIPAKVLYGVHPNEEGNRQIADFVYRELGKKSA